MPLMIYCTAALTSFSDSISYITYLFSEWRIQLEVGLMNSSVSLRMSNTSQNFQERCSGHFLWLIKRVYFLLTHPVDQAVSYHKGLIIYQITAAKEISYVAIDTAQIIRLQMLVMQHLHEKRVNPILDGVRAHLILDGGGKKAPLG